MRAAVIASRFESLLPHFDLLSAGGPNEIKQKPDNPQLQLRPLAAGCWRVARLYLYLYADWRRVLAGPRYPDATRLGIRTERPARTRRGTSLAPRSKEYDMCSAYLPTVFCFEIRQ